MPQRKIPFQLNSAVQVSCAIFYFCLLKEHFSFTRFIFIFCLLVIYIYFAVYYFDAYDCNFRKVFLSFGQRFALRV